VKTVLSIFNKYKALPAAHWLAALRAVALLVSAFGFHLTATQVAEIQVGVEAVIQALMVSPVGDPAVGVK